MRMTATPMMKMVMTKGSESEEERPLLKEEIELARLIREHDDDDPMKAFMVKEKREEVDEALKKLQKSKKKGYKHNYHPKGHRRDQSRERERTNRRIKDASEEPDSRRKERSRRDNSADRDRRAKRDSEELVPRRKEYPRRDHSRVRERDRRRYRSGSRDRRHRD